MTDTFWTLERLANKIEKIMEDLSVAKKLDLLKFAHYFVGEEANENDKTTIQNLNNLMDDMEIHLVVEDSIYKLVPTPFPETETDEQ